ncbi:MAG: sugar phosphate isomerase/epimerase family protein [Elusimicrobiota bacterium]
MKYSVFTVMMPTFTLEQVVEQLAVNGYDGVEWRIHPDNHIRPYEVTQKAKSVAQMCHEKKVEICALATYFKCSQVEELKPIFEAAAVMNCPQVRVGTPAYDRKDNYNAVFKNTVDSLQKIEGIAADYNIKANIEIHMGLIVPSASAAYRLVSYFNPRHIGVIYDPGNMMREGYENWKMGMEILGLYLAHVHVKNSWWQKVEGKWKPSWAPLKEGMVDWNVVMADLKSVGYDKYLSFEDFADQPVEQKVVEDIKYLKEIEGRI